MSISDQLRKLILASELSQNELARQVGIKQPLISRFISGRDMALTTADKLADFFGLELRPAKKPKKKPSAGK